MDATVHTALWITYLCRQFRTPPKQLPSVPRLDVIKVLAANRRVDDPLLGVALWNLLSAYGDKPPKEYTDLFRQVYRYEAAQAREAARGKEAPVFPLDPQQIVQEPLLKLEETLDASTVRLELCVGSDFALLKDIVDPGGWSACELFWKGTRAIRSSKQSTVSAQLLLPDVINKTPLDVTLNTEVSRGQFEVRTDFQMVPNDRIEVCRGFASVQKEAGRPGLIRITQQRTVRFAPEFDRYRQPTILYWLQAEIAGTVLERLHVPARQATQRSSPKQSTPRAKR